MKWGAVPRNQLSLSFSPSHYINSPPSAFLSSTLACTLLHSVSLFASQIHRQMQTHTLICCNLTCTSFFPRFFQLLSLRCTDCNCTPPLWSRQLKVQVQNLRTSMLGWNWVTLILASIFWKRTVKQKVLLNPPPYYQEALFHLNLTLMIGQGGAALNQVSRASNAFVQEQRGEKKRIKRGRKTDLSPLISLSHVIWQKRGRFHYVFPDVRVTSNISEAQQTLLIAKKKWDEQARWYQILIDLA